MSRPPTPPSDFRPVTRPPLTDIHCHFVPGVDDGAPDLESALHYLGEFVEMGVTRVATTPHLPVGRIDSAYRRRVESSFETLSHAARLELPELELSLAYEIRLDGSGREGGHDLSDPGLWLGEERRILMEFSMLRLPEEPIASLAPVFGADLVPVLAHPERYGGMAEGWKWVERLRGRGTLFCLNAGSLWGGYGPVPEELAWRMLAEGSADLIGSDHHGRPHRADTLERAWEVLAAAGQEEAARLLMSENPAAVLEGRPARPVPPVSRASIESARTAIAGGGEP